MAIDHHHHRRGHRPTTSFVIVHSRVGVVVTVVLTRFGDRDHTIGTIIIVARMPDT